MNEFSSIFHTLGLFPLAAVCKPFRVHPPNPNISPSHINRTLLLFVLFQALLISCGEESKKTNNNESLTPSFDRPLSAASSNGIRPLAAAESLPPTRFPAASPADWVELTPQEIENELKINPTNDRFLPEDHRETHRVQKLLDELFEKIEAKDPDRFRSKTGLFRIPRPLVRIRESQTINASVIKLSVCRGGNILFVGNPNDLPPQNTDTLIAAIDFRGRRALYKKGEVSCIDRMAQLLSPDDLIHALEDDVAENKRTWIKTGNSLLIRTEGHAANQVQSRQMSGLVHLTTTNLITITTGALKQFTDEQDLQYTLAHELAHYLYAHGSLIKSGYFYFYGQNRGNYRAPRPVPDPSLKNLGDKAAKLPSFRTQPIEGQRFHSEMFPYFRESMKRIVQPSCSDPNVACFSACKDLKEIVEASNDFKEFGTFPQGNLTPKALQLYRIYENQFSTCMATISIREDTDEPSFGSVSKEVAQRIFWNADIQRKKNLNDLALEMNDRTIKKDSQQNSVLAEALSNRLGYFTTEEEADNLALDWTIQFGIGITQTFTYWINYAYSMRGKEQDAPFSFGYNRCSHFFRAFADKIYEEAPLVPVGSYADPHHSLCYRAFHTAKRLEARYQVRMNPNFIRDVFSRLEENPTMPSESLYSRDEQSSLDPHPSLKPTDYSPEGH